MAQLHPREELISALVDGKLDIAATHRLAVHLRECDRCRSVLTDFEINKSLFRKMAAPPALPEQFWDDAFRKMRTSEPIASARQGWRLPVLQSRNVRAAFAVAACLAVAIVVPLTHGGVTPPLNTNNAASSIPDDTLDAFDVSSFVRAHTEAVSAQPLSDPDRQQMIAADADASPVDQVIPATDTIDGSQ